MTNEKANGEVVKAKKKKRNKYPRQTFNIVNENHSAPINITMPDINISTNVSTVVNVDEDHSRTTTTTTPAAGNSHDGSSGVSDLGDLLTGLDRLFK